MVHPVVSDGPVDPADHIQHLVKGAECLEGGIEMLRPSHISPLSQPQQRMPTHGLLQIIAVNRALSSQYTWYRRTFPSGVCLSDRQTAKDGEPKE